MTGLVIGSYYWTPDAGSKFNQPYRADDVRKLQKMVARHTTVPHQFAVITDQPDLFAEDADIRAIPIDKATHVPGTCFVRLMTFHARGRELIGERFLAIDLDTMIVGNIDRLVTRQEDLVLWRNPTRLPWADFPDEASRRAYVHERCPEAMRPHLDKIDFRNKSIAWRDADGNVGYVVNQLRTYYNTSVVLHRCGTKPEIWGRFDPKRPPAKDDQWYLSDRFGMDCPYFDGERDGVYRPERPDTPGSGVSGKLPENACIVTFAGSHGKADDPRVLAANPWIAEHLA
jgi:hypothetical protein